MFHIQISKSVLVFHTFAPALLRLMIPTSSLRNRNPRFAAVSLLTFHKSIILAPLWFYVFRGMQIPDPFHFHI